MIITLDMKKLLGFRIGGDAKHGSKMGQKLGSKPPPPPPAPSTK